MAKDKKSFLIYCDVIHTVRKLTNEQAGELFKHLLAYVNDENPVTENPIIDIVFEPIKQQLKRDLIKYESIKLSRSEAGKSSAAKKAEKQQLSTSVKSVEQTSTNLTVTVTDNVKDINTLFELFRKVYPGKKRGNQTELENFKRHKDWKQCLPLLKSAIENQIKEYNAKIASKQWTPEWPNLPTWINQRRWEITTNVVAEAEKPKGLKKPDFYYDIQGNKIPYENN